MIEIDTLDQWESRMLVGRDRELSTFAAMLEEASFLWRVVNVYGTAGIGKSFLLDEFARMARKSGVSCITLDSEHMVKTPEAFCKSLLSSWTLPAANREAAALPDISAQCIRALNDVSSARIVLFIDVYEQMAALDQWLRESFLKQLQPHILIVIAGRHALSEPWFLSPAWRQFICRMPLDELNYIAVEQYASVHAIVDPEQIFRIWRHSQGHPLTMSLVTYISQQRDLNKTGTLLDENGTLPYIVNQWLREVPNDQLRNLVETASLFRFFNQESLSFVANQDIAPSVFHQLIRCSFIRKIDKGWTVHALMRELIHQDLASRAPVLYEERQTRILLYYYNKLLRVPSPLMAEQESTELLYVLGDSVLRAFIHWFNMSPCRFDHTRYLDKKEIEAYMERRKREAKDIRVVLNDPLSSQTFEFSMTAEESCYTLRHLDLDALLALGCDVFRTMRDASGRLTGLAILIPINRRTIPYLKQGARSSAFLESLPPERLKEIAVEEPARAGWFIETIDTLDFSNPSQQAAIGSLLLSMMLTGEWIVESPAPFPYFIMAHESLGFKCIEGATHMNYDGKTPAMTFEFNWQRGQFIRDLHQLLQQTALGRKLLAATEAEEQIGDPGMPTSDPILARSDLTPREKEVAKLLELGLTNSEIASALYISEVTVKKHMTSMLAKLQASNRTQLLKKLLDPSGI